MVEFFLNGWVVSSLESGIKFCSTVVVISYLGEDLAGTLIDNWRSHIVVEEPHDIDLSTRKNKNHHREGF